MVKKIFSLKKEERLCSKVLIDQLFAEGKSFLVYPIKVVYLETELPEGIYAQAAFSVGKKLFKKAVARNLLKRRMKEAYRLSKPDFYNRLKNRQYAIIFIFIGKEKLEYKIIEKGIKNAIERIIK